MSLKTTKDVGIFCFAEHNLDHFSKYSVDKKQRQLEGCLELQNSSVLNFEVTHSEAKSTILIRSMSSCTSGTQGSSSSVWQSRQTSPFVSVFVGALHKSADMTRMYQNKVHDGHGHGMLCDLLNFV